MRGFQKIHVKAFHEHYKKIIMNLNKRILIYFSFACIAFTSCTKDFDNINTDPKQSSSSTFNPNLLLPSSEINYVNAITGYNGAILFQSMWTQTFASAKYPSYYSNADKYVYGGSYNDYIGRTWNLAYSSAGYAYEIQNLVKDKPELSNLSGVALILELLSIQAVTDVYGDCPFTDALQAKAGLTHPVYNTQQDIYNSMLSKLDSVLNTLDASKATPDNDALPYAGDITKWKKFGYSLMLRMAMRLTKVDPSTAQTYAEKAYAGGTFSSIDDNAYLKMDDADGYANGNAAALGVSDDFVEVKWGKYLIDQLKAADDPRLSVIAEVPQSGLEKASDKGLAGNSDPAVQEGMPNGYDQNGGATDISHAPDYPGGTGTGDDYYAVGKYSRVKTALYLDRSSPAFILTYAETELLLAEAAVRGWNVGDASTHYKNGLSAAIQSLGTFNSVGAISAGTADAYAALHPLDVSTTENSLKQINTQYWITTGTLFNWIETWCNWRRSGYPVLTPVNYTGNFSNGAIPRRQIYPLTEPSNNPENYSTAVGNLSGGDTWTAKVWWDK